MDKRIMEQTLVAGQPNAFSCEIEDWFHILDSDKTPHIDRWPFLPLAAERGIKRLLELFEQTGVKATFFCLGWMAQRMPHLVRTCQEAGHEIASHGYAHLLAYRAGPRAFLDDLIRSKAILEDTTGQPVLGFRCPGFAVTDTNRWVFELVAQAGYRYDASVFPARHGHGGLRQAPARPHLLHTPYGPLVEIPVSTFLFLRRRYCLFGGGYLRIAPLATIRWAVHRLQCMGMPLVVYVHPREVDPSHPRLALGPTRRFQCYVGLNSTMTKLQWLCRHYRFTTMRELASTVLPLWAGHSQTVPVGSSAGTEGPHLCGCPNKTLCI